MRISDFFAAGWIRELHNLPPAKVVMATVPLKYADIGINLGDPVFRGIYHGKQSHEDDLEDVIQRALDAGCVKMMITGSNLIESEHAVNISKQYRACAAVSWKS